VDVHTGDHVHQNADWNAGGANGVSVDPPSWLHITGTGGTATSNGDQSSQSGGDTSHVYANTTAYQPNYVWADQSQQVYAGLGGGGTVASQGGPYMRFPGRLLTCPPIANAYPRGSWVPRYRGVRVPRHRRPERPGNVVPLRTMAGT
jgi:hypothetical protein